MAIPGDTRRHKQGSDHVAEWLAAQDPLAASLHAAHITTTHGGHNIYLYQPGLVVDTIRQVVNEVGPVR